MQESRPGENDFWNIVVWKTPEKNPSTIMATNCAYFALILYMLNTDINR
jgi:hypothetical protein